MHKYPKFSVAYIKPFKEINLYLEPSLYAQKLESKSYGEYIIYHNLLEIENITWLCTIGNYGEEFAMINDDLFSFGPIPDGEYSIESLISDDLILTNSLMFKSFQGSNNKEKYFYFKFDPKEDNYTISNCENYLGIDDSLNLKLSNNFKNQKWKIYTINEIENVYSIENQIFYKDLAIENNKLILSVNNNSINQQFYLYKRQSNEKLNVEYPLRKLPKKLIQRQDNIKTVDIGYNIEFIDDCVKNIFLKEISCEKKWINKFNMRYVTKIILKEGSKNIHKNDFKDCISLLSIQLPKSLKFIEEG